MKTKIKTTAIAIIAIGK